MRPHIQSWAALLTHGSEVLTFISLSPKIPHLHDVPHGNKYYSGQDSRREFLSSFSSPVEVCLRLEVSLNRRCSCLLAHISLAVGVRAVRVLDVATVVHCSTCSAPRCGVSVEMFFLHCLDTRPALILIRKDQMKTWAMRMQIVFVALNTIIMDWCRARHANPRATKYFVPSSDIPG